MNSCASGISSKTSMPSNLTPSELSAWFKEHDLLLSGHGLTC